MTYGVDSGPSCCACCGNYVDDSSCVACGFRDDNTGTHDAGADTVLPTPPAPPDQSLAKAEGAGAAAILLGLALLFATQACSGPVANASPTESPSDGAAPLELDAGTNACGIHTGYPGDDACIASVHSGEFLIHYGPASYDDPAEVAKYTLPPGGESVRLVTVPSPSTAATYVTGYSVSERPGMHHLSVYEHDAFILLAQRAHEDVNFSEPGYPDLALSIPAGVPYFKFQAHGINTTSEPALVEAWVTLHTTDSPGQVMNAVVMNGGLKMNVPPQSKQTITDTTTAPYDLTILAMVGHFHTHTSEERVSVGGKVVYTDRNWAEPAWQWQPIAMKKGDAVTWSCDIDNTLTTPIVYNDHVLTSEMCTWDGYVLGPTYWGVNAN